MTVYVLIREDQNHYGYIDTSIGGIFREERAAKEEEQAAHARARKDGLLIEGDEEFDWDVSWKIEVHDVY